MHRAITFIDKLPSTKITIRGKEYPVNIDGNGELLALSIGIGSHMQMTLSKEIKKLMTIYSTDLYWINSKKLKQENISNLTMTDLVEDIISVLKQLNLKNCFLIGFSCYGILALEVAKRMPAELKGIVLVSTPPAWNDKVISHAQSYFETHASPERKLNDIKRKEHFSKIRKPNESIVSVNAYEADAARYWKDFTIERGFLDLLWYGINADDLIMNHFFSIILPHHKLETGIDLISIPVVLFAGQMDFDSVPLLLWQKFPKPSHFTVIDCGETGHWPNLENPNLFDTEFTKWVQKTFSALQI